MYGSETLTTSWQLKALLWYGKQTMGGKNQCKSMRGKILCKSLGEKTLSKSMGTDSRLRQCCPRNPGCGSQPAAHGPTLGSVARPNCHICHCSSSAFLCTRAISGGCFWRHVGLRWTKKRIHCRGTFGLIVASYFMMVRLYNYYGESFCMVFIWNSMFCSFFTITSVFLYIFNILEIYMNLSV